MDKEAEKGDIGYSTEKIAKRYGIDLRKLEDEQKKLGKNVLLKNAIDFELADSIAGCNVSFFGDKIIAVIVTLGRDMQVIEQQYSIRKLEFPYIPGFRAYRELPAIMDCFNKLQEPFDVIFFEGHGIAHPRRLGIASHFGVLVQKPSIGVAQNLLVGEVRQGKIFIDGKTAGAELQTREGSKPIYISPGNMISIDTAVELAKKWIVKPHKLPEPLVIARKYANRVREEFIDNNHKA